MRIRLVKLKLARGGSYGYAYYNDDTRLIVSRKDVECLSRLYGVVIEEE